MTQPRLMGGRYELDGVVGRGGMAEVYRARDIRLDRIVAIKTLRADLARDQIFQARFRREAQSAASLNHPNIVAVYDTGEDMTTGVPVPYIVMEFVDGRTVRDLLIDGHRLLPERSLEIIDGVLRALDYSHQAGIVHRDIKPGNVMVTRNGDVKVMDFGIARAMSDAHDAMTDTDLVTSAARVMDLGIARTTRDAQNALTQTAQVIGTFKYMSPEQAQGERVDSRSDLYSSGCLLYELLTGRPPFTGGSPAAIVYQHIRENPIPPSRVDPDVPPWGDTITLKALAKSPADRYQTAVDIRTDLQRAASGMPVSPGSAAPQTTVHRPWLLVYESMTFGDALANTTTVTGGWDAPAAVDLEVRVPGSVPSEVRSVEIRGTEGEATVPVSLPDPQVLFAKLERFSISLDTARLDARLVGKDERQAVYDLGSLLFNTLFPAKAKMLYYACRAASRRLHRYLRLVLRIGPPHLAALPWEFMWDDESGTFPCLYHPTVRYVEQPWPTDMIQTKVPMRFLGMVAAPMDRPKLKVERERAAVERALHSLIEQRQLRLDWVRGEAWTDLQRKLYKRQYDVFHFVGHGGFARHGNEGYLAFTGTDGSSDRVPASDLAAMLAGQHGLRLAVLNSCESARGDGHQGYTSVAETLVRHGLSAVLAMQNAVSDPVATRFAIGFYDALSALMPIDLAATHGRQAVKRECNDSLEWGSPVLYLRSREPAYLLSHIGRPVANT
jgi:serine/threonine protein kinase